MSNNDQCQCPTCQTSRALRRLYALPGMSEEGRGYLDVLRAALDAVIEDGFAAWDEVNDIATALGLDWQTATRQSILDAIKAERAALKQTNDVLPGPAHRHATRRAGGVAVIERQPLMDRPRRRGPGAAGDGSYSLPEVAVAIYRKRGGRRGRLWEYRMEIDGVVILSALALLVLLASIYHSIREIVIVGHMAAERRFHRALENLSAPNDTVTCRVCDRNGQVVGHIFWSRKAALTMTPRTHTGDLWPLEQLREVGGGRG